MSGYAEPATQSRPRASHVELAVLRQSCYHGRMRVSSQAPKRLDSLLPTEPLLLMGAGPVPIPHAVARANGVVINHLGDTMTQVVEGVKAMGRYAFQTEAEHVLGVGGPSSAAMEMAIANVAWAGRRVLALVTGTFSHRLAEMAQGVGAQVVVVEAEAGQPVRESAVRRALDEAKSRGARFDVVTAVQGETSSGVCNTELQAIAKAAREHGALMVVDAVCTLTTMPLPMDEWDLDVVMTGGQKGLASIPGVSLIAFSDRAWDALQQRPTQIPHWCLDVKRAWGFWGEHGYHYTAPVPGILALYEALRLIQEETLPRRFDRHARSSAALQSALTTMGLELFVDEAHRLNSVLAIRTPHGVQGDTVRKAMSQQFNVEIAGAFGLPLLRIGQMGEQCRSHNLFKVLYALGTALKQQGAPVDVAGGMAALERALGADVAHPLA